MKVTIVCFAIKGNEHVGTLVSVSGNTLVVKVQDEKDPEKFKDVKVQAKQVVQSWYEEEVDGILHESCNTKGFPPVAADPAPADPAPEKAKKEPKAPKEPSNLVPLKAICAELKIQPRVARRKLRKAKGLVGTGGSWEFDPADVEGIKELLSAAPAGEAE